MVVNNMETLDGTVKAILKGYKKVISKTRRKDKVQRNKEDCSRAYFYKYNRFTRVIDCSFLGPNETEIQLKIPFSLDK